MLLKIICCCIHHYSTNVTFYYIFTQSYQYSNTQMLVDNFFEHKLILIHFNDVQLPCKRITL